MMLGQSLLQGCLVWPQQHGADSHIGSVMTAQDLDAATRKASRGACRTSGVAKEDSRLTSRYCASVIDPVWEPAPGQGRDSLMVIDCELPVILFTTAILA